MVRSSFCSASSCIEVSPSENGEWVWIRTDDPLMGSIPVTPEEWDAFIAGVKAGEFDRDKLWTASSMAWAPMSDCAIRAWRDMRGNSGVTIGYVYPVGYDNHVVEIDLSDDEIDAFIAAVQAARERAREATDFLREPLPGPYERWPETS